MGTEFVDRDQIETFEHADRLLSAEGDKFYRKTGLIRAVQMDHPFVVKTLHGFMEAEAGDFLAMAEGEPMDFWPISKERFEATYEPAEPKE